MKKRILSILLLCCMVLTLLPTTVSAADGPMNTIPKYDVSIDVYNRTSDISIKDSRSYYIYSSVPDKLRDTWAWDKKIFIKGDKTAPHVFIDGVNIEMSPSSKGPAIELNKKASAYIYFIGKNSSLQGADGRAAIQKNRSEGQLYVLARTGTTVTCKGGDKAAGIGGSYATRNISNGYYNGDMYGHGVNMHFGSRSNPDYWGGTIAAIGGRNGAGIGAGRGGAGEKLYFYSGTIQATGGRFASGIGGSYEGRGSEIYIHGGTVSAQGGEGGAGIGGGCWKTEQDMNGINAAHDIYISGGTVTAKGGYNGAGIGGGQYVPARNITVTGGVVTATGHYGAAIGGGRWCRGMDITLTDATLNLSTNYRSNGSDAAAVGYGDIVYKPEQLVADPSIATNDRIKVGSKDGKIVMLTANGHALRTDGKPSYFMHLTDFLIPDSDGMIDLSLLTLPYTQNYGWAITDLDVKMMETSCEGNHTYGWKNRNGCHVWGCTRCPARNPLERGPVPDGEHIPGEWENQEKKCTVCGHKLMKDTTPPVIEGIANGMEYTADDTDDGQPGTISFTVSDPVRDKEVSSGVKSVTINGEEQTVQTGQTYQLTAPDGGNNDEGFVYEVVATDNAGNSTTTTIRLYRRHRVLILSDRNDPSSAILHLGVPHGFELELPFDHLPKEAYFVDWDNEDIKISRGENNDYNFGIINSNRKFLLVIPKTELPTLTVRVGNKSFWDYRADAPDEFCYVDPVDKYGEGYAVSLGISSDETSYYFETATRYTLKELKELDDKGSIKWYKYNSESWSLTLIGPSFEDYHGEWYVYAKATNEVGTKYVSSPKLILDCSDPAATVHPSGKELEGKANSSTAAVEGTTYWGNLQFKVHDETPVTVQDGQTVLKPDENGIYTIPADMDDNVYHNIYIRDSCGNTIFYLKNKVRWNTLAHVDTLDEQKLPHGAVLSESLPATVTVRTAASGNQSVSVPVKWDEAADYVPAAKREQHFTVTGTLDLSGTDIVVPPEQEALQTVTVEVTVAGAPQYRVTAASSENGTVTVVNATETAEDGTPLFCKDDLVMLSIAPNEGYMLSTLSINGTPASFAVEDDTYTFAQPEENVTITATFEKRNEHTITFDANGGSEPEDLPEEVTTAMPAKKVLRGSEYSLPECEFIAPEGKQFKAWEIDGTEYPVNAPVTVTADITVKALWEDAPPAHEHSYGDWSKDGTSHWHECTDDDCPNREESIKDKAAHVYGDDADTTCDVCGYERTVTPPTHEHSYGDWSKDGTSHWRECTDADCPDRNESIKDKAAHVYTDDADTTCNVCGYERTVTPPSHEHSYGDWSKDGTSHWHECTDADCPDRNESIKDKAAHVYDDDADTTCNVCGYERTVTPPAPTEYTITYDLAGGTAEGNPDTYTIETVDFTLKNPTKSGYTFTGWSGTGLDGENNMTVTIPTGSTGNRAYTAHWRYNGSGHSYSYYTIKATAGAGGSISPSGNVSVREGRDQTFTITPDKGYAVANVKIDGKSIGAVKSYTFENVSRTHTIEVIFMKANGNPQTGVFVDVATGSYYEDAVDWAVENGITKGTDDTHFSPDGICTRAQAVTFLWRAAGSPEPETRAMPFNDVPVGSYYYDAVLWAVENGITKGTSDTTFSPNMTCSRAQIVTFLWRSEKSPAAGTANPFADVKSTAYYADAVLWAVKENITKGTTSTTFSPNADCTRAQIVTFLWRCKK